MFLVLSTLRDGFSAMALQSATSQPQIYRLAIEGNKRGWQDALEAANEQEMMMRLTKQERPNMNIPLEEEEHV